MALTPRLEFRQSQALVMTPQLMQAIKLLQLSHLDLAAYVENELERNPLLERVDADTPGGTEPSFEPPVPVETTEPAAGIGTELETSREALEAGLDADLENVFPDDAGAAPARTGNETPLGYTEWNGVGPGGRADGESNLENFVASGTTLASHLADQMALAITDGVERLIGRYLIDLVDEAGYLTAELDVVAEKLGVPLARVERVLSILQTFEPVGVCARDLAECLALQLRERDRYDPAMQALVAHLGLLAKRDLAALRAVCGVDADDLADMITEIRALDPKPGLAFGAVEIQPVVPDILVWPSADGSWQVELNTDTLPKLLVDQTYHARVATSARDVAEKTYLTECLQSATWLVRALDQRAKTILKVASEIVRQQDAFFTHGVQHLRPLNLKTVADAIGMHESTVSRVTANKYVATSRGIFELKYFFTAAIAAANGGESHSAEAVRHRIRQMIEVETPHAVLSDDTIVEKLHESGIDIARRTVAKYREAMRIPSSVQRRREKRQVMGL